MKRALCIWLPNWPVQRIIAVRPELNFRPVVLFHRDARRGQLVYANSTAASKLGIRPRMPLTEAEAMLQHVRQPILIEEHQPQADYAELEQLAMRCEQFSSLVGIEDEDQPSSILLDIASTADLLGGETKLTEQIMLLFRQQSYLVRIGVADTLGAAWAVAHFDVYGQESA